MRENTSPEWKGIALVLMGALLFSAKAVIVKLTYRYEISAIGSLFFRMLFAFPFLVWIAWKAEREEGKTILTKKDVIHVIFMGVVGYYLASLFDFLGLKYISAGLERIILFVYPTLVVLLSFLFLKKKIHLREVFSLILTYTGVFLAYGQDVQLGSAKEVSLGAFFILLSALTYAIYLMGSGSIIPKLGAKKYTAWALIISSFAVFIHYAIFGTYKELLQPFSFYTLAFVMGTVNTVIPAIFVSEGIKRVGSKTAAIVGSVGPMSTLFLAYWLLDEPITILHSIGTLFVLTGVFWISTAKKAKEVSV
ncbi:DMT family transporter [Leptospira sp. 2 VSF19]|uniref:DMT family transporter n=1 Tax=Leptospira soteropolitanensis TaxID=2950025 RepID=A0AAW5VG65_9LEPT|nr:DMT family transporter [Leptospira soteropolitanensis]MCW7492624.1 DMT family transporter [Leptospira soteropolitanensis]MCW7500307.1 DMT family transporter [Leptospira soteropolitanensis]MCW7522658.1 DMT family transporter [Leptospira soteropolitanensis]MCW7526514.1 DMT family transporter [Leptospira soteropolitanensis]MCW7530277.1 DMT family transporter [Leptospira soteropolitanensis]